MKASNHRFIDHLRRGGLQVLPPLLAHMIRLLHRSCRFTVLGQEHEQEALSYGRPILHAAWHFTFPAMIYYFRDRNGMLMVSRSRDAEWVARVLDHLGYRTARGSSGKGGSMALRHMIHHVRKGVSIGLIADGSQGPPRVAQPGSLILARHTQAPLVPVSMAAHPSWRFRSWDRTMLVKPFGRVVMAFGAPLWVDAQAPSHKLESLRERLEISLNDLTRQAEETLGRSA